MLEREREQSERERKREKERGKRESENERERLQVSNQGARVGALGHLDSTVIDTCKKGEGEREVLDRQHS
jgi:hypothetical protein